MDDLFDKKYKKQLHEESPLAERMRPLDFNGFFGQEELIGKGSPLRKAIDLDNITSLILWGPPGSGKTTLARIIASKTKSHFVKFSASTTGTGDVKKEIELAEKRRKFNNQKTILFIDEIHRFNKSQQDIFLSYIEEGIIVLIGATTENPSFGIISPLLSRSAVYVLKSLSYDALKKILRRALNDKENGFGSYNIKMNEEALNRLVNYADGDARATLNGLEFAINFFRTKNKNTINENELSEVLAKHALRYDKKGEEHYNLISAYIKTLRDSDPDAALYWLERMIESGENPRFIARRMVIFASEDIGNANPNALRFAVSIANAVEYVGLPEAQINLAHGTTYLATSPKSRASYKAMLLAKEDAKRGSFGVPMHLRNAVTPLMKKVGYGKQEDKEKNNFPPQIGKKRYYKFEREA